MFKRDHHLRIQSLLQSLDADLLTQRACYFGGGTAIVLSHDEYRESVDVDFIVSNRKGYQDLRQQLTERGINALAKKNCSLSATRELRADQYGIRSLLRVAEVEIKFEIILEARIDLEKPAKEDQICGITTLTTLDMATTKLLANSDRWSDDSVFSRDLIDLAMLNLPSADLQKAIEKATGAYGAGIQRDLKKAIDQLRKRKGRLAECMTALKMDAFPPALLWKHIRDCERSAAL